MRVELDHQRELASIRAQSHALIWTGTVEELTKTISRWYEAGWLTAESPQDALQKAAIHFVDTNGKPIIKPTSAKTSQTKPTSKTEEKPSRRAFVMPLLEAKGWSILDWANEAGVSHATAMDYLQDRTKPYRSSRLKLAKVLGVPVEQLPK
jgi:lambda repressor-like predicted transcriptional regulator